MYNRKGQSYFAQYKWHLTHTYQRLKKTFSCRVCELLPEEASINITPAPHPRATYLSLFIWSGPFGACLQVSKTVACENTSASAANAEGEGIGVSPSKKIKNKKFSGLAPGSQELWGLRGIQADESIGSAFNCHWIPCWPGFQKNRERERERERGNLPQEASWDVRKTFSGSICQGELRPCRVCVQGPGLSLSKQNTVTFLLLRRKESSYSAYFCPQRHLWILC